MQTSCCGILVDLKFSRFLKLCNHTNISYHFAIFKGKMMLFQGYTLHIYQQRKTEDAIIEIKNN